LASSGAHKNVTFRIGSYFFQRLAGVFGHDLVEAVFVVQISFAMISRSVA